MKRYILLPVVLFVLLILSTINIHPVKADETNPCTIYGTVKYENGIAVEESIIIVENINTREKNNESNNTITGSPIQIITDLHGRYTFELKNLKNGYKYGDEILVTAEKGGKIGSKSIILSEDSWGERVDITLGNEDFEGKDLRYAGLGNIWILFLELVLVIILIAFVSLKKWN